MLTRYKNLALAIIVLSGMSCTDFLTEKPYSFLAPENYYQNENDALAALTGAYIGLGDNSNTLLARRLHYLTWFTSDDSYPPRLAAEKQLDNFTFAADNANVNQVWTQMYDAINRANTVIDQVSGIDMNEAKRNQYVSEAKFIRALCYFYGVQLWGKLPLIDKEVTSVDQVSGISRAPIADIYNLIISDLEACIQYLPNTNQDGRTSLPAAKGLLAKVYLTRASSEAKGAQDYEKCAALAKEVIDMPEHFLMANYQDAIGAEDEFNPESLFEWQGDRNLRPLGNHSVLGQFTLPINVMGIVPEAGQSGNSDIVSEIEYFNLYDDRDYRKESTFITEGLNRLGVVTDWTKFTYPFPHPAWKYVDQSSGTRSGFAFSGNYTVLRLADVYLMRAEALNEMNGPTTDAYAMINAIRARARHRDGTTSSDFPADLSGLTKEQFRDAVLLERAVELGFEGHRWFDLVRTKRMVQTIKAVHPDYPVSDKHYLFPIPADELIINENLDQNPGW